MSEQARMGVSGILPLRRQQSAGWRRWTPYAALVWSAIYAAFGLYWLLGGSGFPYHPRAANDLSGPAIGQFGPAAAWIVVLAAGIPAAALGALMLRRVTNSALRFGYLVAGAVLAGTLLLLMTDINLLILFGYLPYGLFQFIAGAEFGRTYLQAWAEWTVLNQVFCLAGGFLWLAATVGYARWSADACPVCGRRDGPEGWTRPDRARRWGAAAAYASMAVPLTYAVTRYAWALGVPLGMSRAQLESGQASGLWTSGLFLASFGLAGAALTLGLVQRWGEVFPRWMIGLAGRRVPVGLAVIPASIVSVLLVVGGLAMWTGYAQMSAAVEATGQEMSIVVGPVALFPAWGVLLALATLGYYYRRRGPCRVCGRGK